LLGKTAVPHLSAEAKRISAALPQLERRDVELAIQHWQRNTWGKDSIPFLDTFDFSPMRTGWGHRFLICGGGAAQKCGVRHLRLRICPVWGSQNQLSRVYGLVGFFGECPNLS
jgi:hypothetical protein